MAGPCDLRAELQDCVDEGRQLVCDLGLCPESVDVITLEWSGNAALPQEFQYGLPPSTQLSRITITPNPRISNPRPELIAADPGTYLKGDRIISRITRVLTEDDLGPVPDAPGGEKIERYFLIDNIPYRQIRELEKQNFEWIIHVRRMRDRLPPDVIPP